MSVKRYLIEFYKEADESIVINAGGTVRHNFPLIPEKLSAVLSEEAYESLLNNDNIKNIEEVKKGTGAAQTHHWGLIYTAVDIGYKGVFTGNGVKVAIIDTGISSHSDLPAPVGWVDYISSQATPYDDHGHGTFIAGLIAAQDNSMGYYGVAPDVDLYVAKVLDSNNAGYSDDFIAGINWAIAQGVDIINFSIYMDDWDETTVRDACRAAYNAGIVVVACSGNGTLNDFIAVNQVCAPAKDYSCVAVGSINLNGYRSSFSNYGTGLDLVAPGEGLSSTYPTNTYANWSGTSFATAMVTGHFAALKEKYPSYTRAQLVSKLLSRCDGVGSVSEYGAGCVMADIPVLAVTDPTNYGCSWSVQGLSSPWDDGNYIACAITHYGDLPYGSAYAPDPILDIQYAPSSGSNYNTPYSSFDAGLSPGTTYTLYAYCQAANGLWYPVRTSKITTLPYGVLLNTPSYVRSWKSSGRVTVFWSESMASPFAEGWQFFYKRHIDSTWTQL
jgi:subtilisin